MGWCTVTTACSLAPITLITFSCTLPKSTESTNRHGNHSFPPLLTEDAALCARCHHRALCTSLGPGRGRSWSQSTGCCHEVSCGVSPASSFSFSWGGTVLAVQFQEGEWGSPLWLTPGQGNSGQSWRPAFLETHPSGDYTVRVKPAPFRSCSPRLTFKCLKSEKRSGAELSGREVGCTGRLALLSAGLCSGDSTGTGGAAHGQGPKWGPMLAFLPPGPECCLPEAWVSKGWEVRCPRGLAMPVGSGGTASIQKCPGRRPGPEGGKPRGRGRRQGPGRGGLGAECVAAAAPPPGSAGPVGSCWGLSCLAGEL